MIEGFLVALVTLLIALYVQARRAAREIRDRRTRAEQYVTQRDRRTHPPYRSSR